MRDYDIIKSGGTLFNDPNPSQIAVPGAEPLAKEPPPAAVKKDLSAIEKKLWGKFIDSNL
jgi:hypothetical protein